MTSTEVYIRNKWSFDRYVGAIKALQIVYLGYGCDWYPIPVYGVHTGFMNKFVQSCGYIPEVEHETQE